MMEHPGSCATLRIASMADTSEAAELHPNSKNLNCLPSEHWETAS